MAPPRVTENLAERCQVVGIADSGCPPRFKGATVVDKAGRLLSGVVREQPTGGGPFDDATGLTGLRGVPVVGVGIGPVTGQEPQLAGCGIPTKLLRPLKVASGPLYLGL